MEAAIKAKFTNIHNPISFSLEIELDDEIISIASTSLTVDQDSELVIEIAKHLQVHAENGSEYYWEIRNMHTHKKLGEPTGGVTVYFGCTQREGCEHARHDNIIESTKREWEVRPAIERYPCKGSIAMKIDHQRKRAVVSISHQRVEVRVCMMLEQNDPNVFFDTNCTTGIPIHVLNFLIYKIDKLHIHSHDIFDLSSRTYLCLQELADV